jgi:AraC-like DNA-binding protein
MVRKAITTIRERYDEPLSLDDLARSATMSKYYFLRTFRCYTGMTPVRFLSAVRIHEAKRLLFATPMNVAEISVQVGYGSLGTFTRRFTECVGLSPTLYRQVARGEAAHPASKRTPGTSHCQFGSISGTISAAAGPSSTVFIGVFETGLPQGQPIAHAEITRTGPWRICPVPSGSWHVLAAATTDEDLPSSTCTEGPTGRRLLIAMSEQIRVPSNTHVQLDLTLRPLDWTSPPVLVALPGVERDARQTWHGGPGRSAVPASINAISGAVPPHASGTRTGLVASLHSARTAAAQR